MAQIIPESTVNALVADIKPEPQVEAKEVTPEPEVHAMMIRDPNKGNKNPIDRPKSPVKDGPITGRPVGPGKPVNGYPGDGPVTGRPVGPGKPVNGYPGFIDTPHTIYPGGDLLDDVQTHVRCQEMFAMNVQRLITEFLSMKVDLAKARTDLRESQRKLWSAESDRDKYKRSSDQFEADLIEANKDLAETKKNLVDATTRLAEKIEQLTKAKEELKSLRRELQDAKRRITGLERDLEYHKDRVKSLEEELRKANNGENAANDRNTELTRLLYRVEGDKARIEREKDKELDRANHIADQMAHAQREISDLKEQLKKKK